MQHSSQKLKTKKRVKFWPNTHNNEGFLVVFNGKGCNYHKEFSYGYISLRWAKKTLPYFSMKKASNFLPYVIFWKLTISYKRSSSLSIFNKKQSFFVFYQTLHLIFRLFSEKVWIYHLKAIILVLLVLQCLMGIIKISHLLKKKKSYFMERQLTKYWVFVYSYLYFVKVMFGRYH